MIGIDTSFLVAFEDADHESHRAARELASSYAPEGFALAPQVLTEFVQVVTDPHRFENPLTVQDATSRAECWWTAKETKQVFPTADAVSLFLEWMGRSDLGRKRLLDTMLAATYKSADVSLIASTNFRDFSRFPGLHPLVM